MNLRYLLWLAIALLLAYGAWQLLRALRAGRRAATPAAAQPTAVDEDDAGDEGDDTDFADYAPVPARPRESAAPPPPAPVAPAPPGPDAFQLELEVQRLRREVAGLRAVLDVQQQEIGGLHDSLAGLREQIDKGLVAQNASPEYSEALVFARRGLAVDAIAERCGISVAEAELVRSLAARGDEEAGR